MSSPISFSPAAEPHRGGPAWLLLEDGTLFSGQAMGAAGVRFGEAVFSTAMTGYQELLTDPSYAGQILVSTVAHVGNVGINADDHESERCWLQGFIVQQLSGRYSNWRAERSLNSWLQDQGVAGMTEVDTRALVRHLRNHGAMRAVLCNDASLWQPDELMEKLRAWPTMAGSNLVDQVSATTVRSYGDGELRVAALDCGMKEEMLRLLTAQGFAVTRFPATATAGDILGLNPNGVFLSNGPGDPAALQHIVGEVGTLLGKVPIFGICLGHQLLGQALGGSTFKLKFGHRGCNQPVLHIPSGRVEVTTQNHGFAVDPASLPAGVDVTHTNLNDGTCEGLEARDRRAFSVQYHPENAPGPHDSRYLFQQFTDWMKNA